MSDDIVLQIKEINLEFILQDDTIENHLANLKKIYYTSNNFSYI